MGPALSTEELRAWGPSRGLSAADTEQLVAVGIDRDKGWHEYYIAYNDFKAEKALLVTALHLAKQMMPKQLKVDFSREDFATDGAYKEAMNLRDTTELVDTLLRKFG